MLRRTFLQSLAATPLLASMPARIPIGLNTYCLRSLRWNDSQLLEYCASLNLDACFLQDSLDPEVNVPAHWIKVREQAERLGLHLETGGPAFLPKTAEEFSQSVDRLTKAIQRAKGMGSPIVRSLIASDRAHMPPGPLEQHIETAIKVLKAVRSQAMDAGLKIAIENHKDIQCWQTRQVIEGAGKEFVGSYLDTGNPVFVCEDPLTTVETLGPYAVTFHLRDSVVYEVKDGIAVQWVPLGEGNVDFHRILAKAREVLPPVYIYIKPITGRPPVTLPVWTDEFWQQWPKARAKDFSAFLALAKRGQPYDKPMVVEDLQNRPTPPQFLAAVQAQQKEHMERSIAYARKELGLGVKSRG